MASAAARRSSDRGPDVVPSSLSGATSGRRSRIRPVAVLPTSLFARTAPPEGVVYERVCENCGATFQAKRKTAKTCRPRCRRELFIRRHGSD